MTDDFGSGEWLEAPVEATDAVAYLAEQGAISETPVKHRKRRQKEENAAEGKEGETEDGDKKEVRRIYLGTAFDANEFLKMFEGFKFVYYANSWWIYIENSGWEVISDDEMKFKIADFLRRKMLKLTQNSATDLLFALNPFCNIKQPSKIFEPTWFLNHTADGIEAQHAPGWVACKNALLHVPTIARALFRDEKIPENAIKSRSSELFTQGEIPAVFNPEAVCPKWTKFVEEACPNDGAMLQEMFGLSLTYDRSFNAFFVIYGASGTGKSTCLNVLQKLNDGCVSQVSLGRFGERFFIWPLAQNRTNIVHDMDSIYEGDGSVSLREAVLKSVASGESIEVERKHRQAQREHLRALCIFGTNNLPRFADKSNAIGQRMRIIEFPNVFRDTENQVRSLHEFFFEELDGIFIWALKGYGELLESGRNTVWESESSKEVKENSLKDSRPEILFCDDMLEKDDFPTWKSALEIYQAYEKYCYNRGYKAAGMCKVIPLIVEYMHAEKARVRLNANPVSCVRGIRLINDSIDN